MGRGAVNFPRPRLWRSSFAPGAAPAWPAEAGTQARPRAGGRPSPVLLVYALAAVLGLAVTLAAARLLPSALHAVDRALQGSSVVAGRTLPADTLLYTVTDGDHGEIRRLSVEGKAGSAVAPGGLQGAAIASKDGSALLYLRAGCVSCSALYTLRDAGGQTRVLGSAPLRPLYEGLRADAAFSPDDRFVAFAEAGADAPVPHIFLFDRRSGERRALAPYDPAPEDNPVWSPDGERVAFFSGGEKTIVVAADVKTGGLHPLNDQLDHAASLAWSPDGRYLSLLRAGQIWLIDGRSGHGFALAAPGAARALGGWSPGSHELIAAVAPKDPAAQQAAEGSPALEVVALPVDDGAARTLARGPLLGAPRWSADGRRIAWAQGSDTAWTLLIAPSAGGAPQPLASGTGQIALDQWH